MAGGPCWTAPSPARPRRFAAPAGPVPARRGHQDGSVLPSFTCDTPRQLRAASAAALPASAARGMPGRRCRASGGARRGRGRTGLGRRGSGSGTNETKARVLCLPRRRRQRESAGCGKMCGLVTPERTDDELREAEITQ
ncbi:uncharacterized protein [Taeniopygia guttata]|uniref:uncharacterized protein n=1 Tax=Taeniopygia guttata TaxID=59729 RepID=UPI003BB93E8F